jgi:hypothetical protein
MFQRTSRMRDIVCAAFVLFVVSELTGCSSSKLMDVWKDPQYHGTFDNMFVIAVKKDPSQRRIWEDGFVSALEKHGVTATPSYRLFPKALPDTTQVVQAVRDHHYDGVMVTVRLPNQTEHVYVPGYVDAVPVFGYDPWWDVYRTYYEDVYEPGYYETETIARARTCVWSSQDKGTLVWTGTSDVYDPTSSKAIGHEITEMIVPELAKQGLIPAKK